MTAKSHRFFLTVFLIIVLGTSLFKATSAQADGEPPIEPTAATEVVTQPASEPSLASTLTTEPVEAAPLPEATTEQATPVNEVPELALSTEINTDENAPVAAILSQVPEDTTILVLDEEGEPLTLGSQGTADAVVNSDPVWCPAAVAIPTPGANGCSISYGSFVELVTAMRTTPTNFDEAGTIFLEKPSGAGFTRRLVLSDSSSSLAGSYEMLSAYDLTIQGGWDGPGTTTLSGQTNFGVSATTQGYIQIGSAGNPWVGNVSLNDIALNGISVETALRVYTDAGNISLDNVDIYDQGGGTNTAVLNSTTGNIIIQNGSSFDGDGSNTYGLSAGTNGSGVITIRDTSFTNNVRSGNDMSDGASLRAATVTLQNVITIGNDGNGIRIDGANLVTLNHVIATSNGTNTFGSGVLVNGLSGSRVIIIGGEFNNNRRYGVQVGNTTRTSIYVQSVPECENNRFPGCANVTPVFDPSPPAIKPLVNGILGSNGWYRSDVSVSWSVDDDVSSILSSNGCDAVNITDETAGTTLTCSATNKAGLTNSVSVVIKIDKTSPLLTIPHDTSIEATGPEGAPVSYTTSAIDGVDGALSANCSPASGTMFPLGSTVVSCSASDLNGNTTSATFSVTVQDTTPPTITPYANVSFNARGRMGAHVYYPDVPTWDAVDGAGIASCSPSSRSFFRLGDTEVTCTATDSSGNSATSTFLVSVDRDGRSQITQSGGSSESTTLLGGQLTDLDCNSVFWALGVKLSFLNLCDQQARMHGVAADGLPARLPDGFSFVMGVDVAILTHGEIVQALPEGTGIQMDFPTGSDDEFTVLHWDEDKAEWIEAALELNPAKVSEALSSGDEFYHLVNEAMSRHFCQALTTDKTGIFVLVKK